jgi:phage/plasmid primase-like uncharacterized protein
MSTRQVDYDAFLAKARAVRIEDEIERRGIELRGRIDRCGPCPRCGGRDRFAINVSKQVFVCRSFGGGDVIAMVQHLDDCTFMEACETLTHDRPRPALRKETVPAKGPKDYAHQQHEKARRLWSQRQVIAGSIAERYLRKVRKITCPLTTGDARISAALQGSSGSDDRRFQYAT